MKLDRSGVDIAMAKNTMTLDDLADAYGASKSRIAVILNSVNVTAKTAGKLANALGVDVEKITKG